MIDSAGPVVSISETDHLIFVTYVRLNKRLCQQGSDGLNRAG